MSYHRMRCLVGRRVPFKSRDFRVKKVGNRPNTVSESTVSNSELSEFFGPPPSSGERAQ